VADFLISHVPKMGPAVFMTDIPAATHTEDPSEMALARIVPKAIPGAPRHPSTRPTATAREAAGQIGIGSTP